MYVTVGRPIVAAAGCQPALADVAQALLPAATALLQSLWA